MHLQNSALSFVHMRKDLLNRGIVQILSPSAKISESGIVESNEIEEKASLYTGMSRKNHNL